MTVKKRRVMKREVPTFVRPVAAEEVFTTANKKKFNEMPGWERELIRRALDHQNVTKAVVESGIHTTKSLTAASMQNLTTNEALEQVGVDAVFLAQRLKDIMTTFSLKMDKHGNSIKMEDHPTRLKTIELVMKLRGELAGIKGATPPTGKGKSPTTLIEMVKEIDTDEGK